MKHLLRRFVEARIRHHDLERTECALLLGMLMVDPPSILASREQIEHYQLAVAGLELEIARRRKAADRWRRLVLRFVPA